MQPDIIRRIVAQTGVPQLFSVLAEELSPSDLQSLLLAVYRSRAARIHEPGLLRETTRRALLAPSDIDARLFTEFDRIAFATAQDFEAVDLSPVCALGASFGLGRVDQNNVLTTIRNAEVLGDNTPAMAIECARRRKAPALRTADPVRLCSSHRMIRLQSTDFPGYTPHFRLFALVSAGRDTGSIDFECTHLSEHIRFYLDLCRALSANGFSLASPLAEVTDLAVTERLLSAAGIEPGSVRNFVRAHEPGSAERFLAERKIALPEDITDPAAELPQLAGAKHLSASIARLAAVKQRVFGELRLLYPEATFRFNFARLEGLGYYPGLCLRISPVAPDGRRYPVIDGGFTDWTARLLQDRKERLLTSGVGTEFICRRYRRPAADGR